MMTAEEWYVEIISCSDKWWEADSDKGTVVIVFDAERNVGADGTRIYELPDTQSLSYDYLSERFVFQAGHNEYAIPYVYSPGAKIRVVIRWDNDPINGDAHFDFSANVLDRPRI
jgi:hypothetical protein